MPAPRHRGGRFWYPISANPLARVLKFENMVRYLGRVPAGGVVLDYGAGSRPFQDMLVRRFAKYVAADNAQTNIRHGVPPDIFIRESRLEIASDSVDCVLFTEVLEHLYEPRVALAEIHRVLKPGGYVVGSVPFAKEQHEVPDDYYRYTYFALQRMFQDCGFRIHDLDYVGDVVAVLATSFSGVLGVLPKILRRVHLGPLAWLVTLIIRIPEFLYFGLHRAGLQVSRIAYFRQLPLGFTFLLQKPGAGATPAPLRPAAAALARRAGFLTRKLAPFHGTPAYRRARAWRRDLGNTVAALGGRMSRPQRWVFIVGCSNSGTTLLHQALAAHSHIASMDIEGQYYTDQLLRPADVGLPRLWALEPGRFRMDENTPEGDVNVVRLRRQWSARMNDAHRPVFIEKTPANVARMLWLERHFEDAHFIAVVRNGYAVAEGIRRKAGHPLRLAGEQWAKCNEILLDNAGRVKRCLTVRYEDFTVAPVAVLAGILEFIGLEAAGIDIAGREFRVHEHVSTIRNMNASALAALTPDERAEIEAVAGPMLQRLGYARPPEPETPGARAELRQGEAL